MHPHLAAVPLFTGLVTATPGLLLGIMAADCAAVLMAGEVQRGPAFRQGETAGLRDADADACLSQEGRP